MENVHRKPFRRVGHTMTPTAARDAAVADARRCLDTLTQAELRVAVLLVKGLRPKEVAAMRGVSVKTIHSQIACIHAKFGGLSPYGIGYELALAGVE